MVEVKDLRKYFIKRKAFFGTKAEPVKAVDGVSFSVEKGKTFGLVGESGCGKSTVAKLLVGILEPDSGSIVIDGDKDIVFQDPFSSLNPRMTVRSIVTEALRIRGASKEEMDRRLDQTLSLVRLNEPGTSDKYPHQFSGGERQRIAIARAIIRRPKVLVLDEPVSSLDVSIQASILNLLKDLQQELGMTYIFISHDLRIVEFMSDTVGVMTEGRFVEVADREKIYSDPQNEYTRRLLEAIPKI